MITAESLHTEYAGRLASAVGLDKSEYSATPGGLASLLTDTADRLSPIDPNREWLGEAASNLNAVARLDGEGRVTQQLLKRTDRALYGVAEELETY